MSAKKKSNRKHILMRYGWIVVFILLLASGIVYKLADTTIMSAAAWNEKAMKELSRTDTILPQRGDILASDGSILATNLRYYDLRIDYRSEKFLEDTLKKYSGIIADSMAHYFPFKSSMEWEKHLLTPLDKKKENRPRAYKLVGNISYADYLKIKSFPFFSIENKNKNGLTVEDKMRRVNPYGDMARRSIGGVGATVECKEVHGISGLEKALDSLLYGKPGLAKKVPVTKGIVNWTDIPAVNGYNITTTIDIKIQDIVENELNDILNYVDADWGLAVLMDVSTGDIKAISNLEKNPKANNYIEGMNRAVLGYEPGSVIKTLSMLIALEDGIVDNVNETIQTGYKYAYAGGRAISDAHGVNSMTVAEVIERSSNIGMTKIITRKYDSNPGAFYTRLKEIGFLEPMHTGIAGETTPRVDSLPRNKGGRIALSRQCYGYATEIPPLYTLSIYNAIANKGKYVRPRLVTRVSGENFDSILPVSYIRDRICSEENAAKLKDMLTRVVWGEHGTGKLLRNDYVKIAGKTGTCYMIEPTGYNQSKKRLAFCGFFPADNPKYSCIVLTANPKKNALSAQNTSGQVLKNIALKLYSRGMLGNSSDYRSEEPKNDSPTLFASTNKNRSVSIHNALPTGDKHLSLKQTSDIPQGIPNVIGYGLRDAVSSLEKAGYEVEFSGSGHVTGQSIKLQNDSIPNSKIIMLTLSDK